MDRRAVGGEGVRVRHDRRDGRTVRAGGTGCDRRAASDACPLIRNPREDLGDRWRRKLEWCVTAESPSPEMPSSARFIGLRRLSPVHLWPGSAAKPPVPRLRNTVDAPIGAPLPRTGTGSSSGTRVGLGARVRGRTPRLSSRIPEKMYVPSGRTHSPRRRPHQRGRVPPSRAIVNACSSCPYTSAGGGAPWQHRLRSTSPSAPASSRSISAATECR